MARLSMYQRKQQKAAEEGVVLTQPDLKLRDDLLAFLPPVEPDKDFISKLPTETLHEIFSYLVLDHDAERGNKMNNPTKSHGFKDQPHVFLSLAVLSQHFHANVESFCAHYITKYKDVIVLLSRARPKPATEIRRSARLAENPPISTECGRVHRRELVEHLQRRCIQCNRRVARRAVMASGVACCSGCEDDIFEKTINLSTAMAEYDLRDYMLIKSRKPGLRAKHINLPPIRYATVRTGMGLGLGMTVSYRFFKKEVKMIAQLVHGDISAHMSMKAKQRQDRQDLRFRRLHVELKIRYHEEMAAITKGETQAFHYKKAKEFRDPDWNDNYRECLKRWYDPEVYGEYDDIHERVCAIDPCLHCQERKYLKYGYW